MIEAPLYQMDPATAKATLIWTHRVWPGRRVDVNGRAYAFLNATRELATFGLLTGRTNLIGTFDRAAGTVSAAVPTPEPATTAISGVGLAGRGLGVDTTAQSLRQFVN
ncbi:MAG: hypothetical protein ACJ746_02825 [Bryobacteraceae bacterium]